MTTRAGPIAMGMIWSVLPISCKRQLSSVEASALLERECAHETVMCESAIRSRRGVLLDPYETRECVNRLREAELIGLACRNPGGSVHPCTEIDVLPVAGKSLMSGDHVFVACGRSKFHVLGVRSTGDTATIEFRATTQFDPGLGETPRDCVRKSDDVLQHWFADFSGGSWKLRKRPGGCRTGTQGDLAPADRAADAPD